MKTSWTKGLSPDKKEEIKREFDASGILRERLKLILEEKMEVARKGSLSKDAYQSPNWAYLQADAVGVQRALEEVISLLS